MTCIEQEQHALLTGRRWRVLTPLLMREQPKHVRQPQVAHQQVACPSHEVVAVHQFRSASQVLAQWGQQLDLVKKTTAWQAHALAPGRRPARSIVTNSVCASSGHVASGQLGRCWRSEQVGSYILPEKGLNKRKKRKGRRQWLRGGEAQCEFGMASICFNAGTVCYMRYAHITIT